MPKKDEIFTSQHKAATYASYISGKYLRIGLPGQWPEKKWGLSVGDAGDPWRRIIWSVDGKLAKSKIFETMKEAKAIHGEWLAEQAAHERDLQQKALVMLSDVGITGKIDGKWHRRMGRIVSGTVVAGPCELDVWVIHRNGELELQFDISQRTEGIMSRAELVKEVIRLLSAKH